MQKGRQWLSTGTRRWAFHVEKIFKIPATLQSDWSYFSLPISFLPLQDSSNLSPFSFSYLFPIFYSSVLFFLVSVFFSCGFFCLHIVASFCLLLPSQFYCSVSLLMVHSHFLPLPSFFSIYSVNKFLEFTLSNFVDRMVWCNWFKFLYIVDDYVLKHDWNSRWCGKSK